MTNSWIEDVNIPLDPKKGSAGRLKPHVRTIKKGGVEFLGIIPAREGRPLIKIQGPDPDTVRHRMRQRMHQLTLSEETKVKLSDKDLRDVQTTLEELAKQDMADVTLEEILVAGLRVTCATHELKYEGDLITLGIERVKARAKKLGEAFEEFMVLVPPPKRDPLVKGDTQAQSIRAHLKLFVDTLGAGRPFVEVCRDLAALTSFMNHWIHTEKGGLALTYRQKVHSSVRRFFSDMCAHYDVPNPLPSVFGKSPRGERLPIVAPDPGLIDRLLNWQAHHRPDMLLYTLLQALCGLRPEEAYMVLKTARKQIVGTSHLVVEYQKKTRSSVDNRRRNVRLRPGFLEWLKRVPNWSDSEFDHRPKGPDGQPMSANGLQSALNAQIVRMGWQGKMPKESLRKSWISACVAVGIPKEEFIIVEAGHTNIITIENHYDAKWTSEMGMALFSIFPGVPNPVPSEWERVHAYGQQKGGL